MDTSSKGGKKTHLGKSEHTFVLDKSCYTINFVGKTNSPEAVSEFLSNTKRT